MHGCVGDGVCVMLCGAVVWCCCVVLLCGAVVCDVVFCDVWGFW